MTLETLLARLDGVRPRGEHAAMARCPAHEDRQASLKVDRGDDGKILLHCHAGCSFQEITRTLGVDPKDLFPDSTPAPRRAPLRITVADLARAKAIPEAFLKERFGLYDLPGGRGVAIPYHDATGAVIETKRRTSLVAKTGSFWPKGRPLLAYVDVQGLALAREKRRLVVTEGESDTWTLALHDIPALGLPGASSESTLTAEHLDGIDELFITEDADAGAGAQFVARVRARARALGFTGPVATVTMPGGVKDPSDWYRRDGEQFRASFQEAARAAREAALVVEPGAAGPVLNGHKANGQRPGPVEDEAPEPGSYDGPAPGALWQPIDPKAPLSVARLYRTDRVRGDEIPDLYYWQGDFWASRETHYEILSVDAVRAGLFPWLERQCDWTTGKPIKPNRTLTEEVLAALRAEAFIDLRDAPAWLGTPAGLPDPREIIACRNGMLHLPSRSLLPLSRRYFGLNALAFDYVPDAPEPGEWLAFLSSLWSDDRQAIETLQEVFGLALTADTSHQKAFLIVGPRRSGKGTIARVLVELVGSANVTAPMLASLGQPFGLESMIGKLVALVSDARIGGRADLAAIVENLLRISGEDTISVPRKFKPDWTGRLRARFVILSNELPALLDQSGALAGRFIVLRLVRSFYGSEDLGLTQRILGEMPSILLWALAGLDRLRDRGHFIQPASAVEMVKQLETLASPIKSFVAERCVVAPGASIECRQLFKAWTDWTRDQGRDHAGSLQVFGRNLAAAFPAITVTRPRIGGSRERQYQGIRLREAMDPEPED